jgi:hypothetical protein
VRCRTNFKWILRILINGGPPPLAKKVKAKIFAMNLALVRRLPTIPIPGTRSTKSTRLPGGFSVSPYKRFEAKDPAYKAGCLCRSVVMENTMLSPHEFATLLLVQEAPNQVDMEREELDALLERQLVQLENLASGRQQWRLTATGDSTVKAFKRYS